METYAQYSNTKITPTVHYATVTCRLQLNDINKQNLRFNAELLF